MTVRPLTQRAWQIAAAIDGRLSCVVVPMKVQFPDWVDSAGFTCFTPKGYVSGRGRYVDDAGEDHGPAEKFVKTPFAVGDRLWIREPWKTHSSFAGLKPSDVPTSTIFYRADECYSPSNIPWRSSTTMPRRFSRLTYVVDSVRVCRVQEVTEEEARACGSPDALTDKHGNTWPDARWRIGFAQQWNADHGSWEANPWCAIGRVVVHNCNVDALAAEKETDR